MRRGEGREKRLYEVPICGDSIGLRPPKGPLPGKNRINQLTRGPTDRRTDAVSFGFAQARNLHRLLRYHQSVSDNGIR